MLPVPNAAWGDLPEDVISQGQGDEADRVRKGAVLGQEGAQDQAGWAHQHVKDRGSPKTT